MHNFWDITTYMRKKRCFSITNFFEGQLWRCAILKVFITNNSNFAYTLINIFSRQNLLEKWFMSIFVGVISKRVKSGRLQMVLHFMKKCVFFSFEQLLSPWRKFFTQKFSSSPSWYKYYKLKTTLVLIENQYGGEIEHFVYD